jgi:hypothetical protein
MSFAIPTGMTAGQAIKVMAPDVAPETPEPAITPAAAQQDPEIRDGVARAPRGRRKSEN